MPHCGDKTIVTCAGDAEVRVFDIEKSGRSTIPSIPPNSTSMGRRFDNIYKGVQYLNYGDTNTRIYRSHADRVKRIVTESSPFLFLCVSPERLAILFKVTDIFIGHVAKMARYERKVLKAATGGRIC